MTSVNLDKRPFKEGYLKIQINSTFNIWNTRYFYLDGYNLAYFWDENTDKPTQVVDLEGCVIDGLWPNSDLYTFTIRSLNNDNDIYYLGAYSEAEAYDWLKNLQAAVKLIEYEKMTEKLKASGPFSLNDLPTENPKEEEPTQVIEESPDEDKEDKEFEDVQTIADDRWWQYLRTNKHESQRAPAIQKGYQEFSSIIKDKKMHFTLLKTENFMNIYKNDDDPHYTIYKSSIVMDGDFYNIVKVLQTDSHEKFWNLYLKSIKLSRKVEDKIQVFEARYDQELWNFIFTFDWKYVREAWIKGSSFNLIRMSIENPEKDYVSNLLSLDMPIEMFGIKLKKVEGMPSKNKMVIVTKVKKRKVFLFNRIFEKFIKKYLIAFSIIRDQLEELYNDINGPNEIDANTTKVKKAASDDNFFDDIPDLGDTDTTIQASNVITLSKSQSKSSKFMAEKKLEIRTKTHNNHIHNPNLIEQSNNSTKSSTPKHPAILPFLDFNVDTQLEAYKSLKTILKQQRIELSDEMIRRFLFAREFDLDICMREINQYVEWIKHNDFSKMSLDDPIFQPYLSPPVWREIGYDRENKPIAVLNLSTYYPDKTPHENFKKYIAFMLYEMNKRFKPGVGQFYLIFDLTDVGSDNLSLSQSKDILKVLQTFFPAYSIKIFLVNMGFVFRTLFKAVQPFLKPRVKKRLVICNTANNEVYEKMKEFFDDDNIPTRFGGSNPNY